MAACLQIIRGVLQLSGISSPSNVGLSHEGTELGRAAVAQEGALWIWGDTCWKISVANVGKT